jgi:cell division protein FtsB
VAGRRRLRAGFPVSARGVGAAALALSALAILAFGGQSLTRVWQMKREVEGLEREIARLRTETTELEATVDRLRSDPDSIEKVAREALGLVKPGERVLKLPPSPGGQ